MGGKQDVFREGAERAAYGNRFLAAAYVHSANDLSLPVQFPLDAIFYLTHERHVVETLVSQVGLKAALRKIGCFRTGSVESAHGDFLVLETKR